MVLGLSQVCCSQLPGIISLMRTAVCPLQALCLRLSKNPFAGLQAAAQSPGSGGWLPRTSVGRARRAAGHWLGWPGARWVPGWAVAERRGTPPRWGEAWQSGWTSRAAGRAARQTGAAPPGSGWCCGEPECSCGPHSSARPRGAAGVPAAAAA